jgi:DHA1 family multidrug resistance protein-like MFS transporter
MSTTPDLHPPNAHSSRSSLTYAEHSATKPAISHEKLLNLEGVDGEHDDISAITTSGEDEPMRYARDDNHGPPARTPTKGCPGPSPPTEDPNMVDWDGNDDPANPQNWSLKYKWFITVIAIITCMNVYVLAYFILILELKVGA